MSAFEYHNVICNNFKKYNKINLINLQYGHIYLVNILHRTLIYSKYTPSVTIILKPFNANNNH
jgi:hypothetical protein